MIPPLTPPMWTSITSGVNPGKHGVFAFYRYNSSGKALCLHNALTVRHPRIHDMTSYFGLRSLVINLPLFGWPPIKIRGAYVSEYFSPKHYASPDKLNKVFMKYYSECEKSKGACKYAYWNIALAETLVYALETMDFDYIFVMFDIVDRLIHKDPDKLLNPKLKCIVEAFNAIDKAIKTLIHRYFDEALIIVVSDHGADFVKKEILINAILAEKGLITWRYEKVRKSDPMDNISPNILAKIISSFAPSIIKHKYLGNIAMTLGRYITRIAPFAASSVVMDVQRPIPNPNESIAFVPTDQHFMYGIYVNENKVTNTGLIIRKIIRVIKDFEKRYGEKIFYYIGKGRGELYQGPYENEAPHIVVVPNLGYSAGASLTGRSVDMAYSKGDHMPFNMHMVTMPANGETEIIEKLAKHIRKPWDYAILALYGLGIPIPHDTDSELIPIIPGKVRKYNYNDRYSIMLRLSRIRNQL